MPPRLAIYPPLLNSACPWATTAENLRALLEAPSTGAVTVRTSILAARGFDHQPEQHRYVFFDAASGRTHSRGSADGPSPVEHWNGTDGNGGVADADADAACTASLNTLGYSPISLGGYLDILQDLSAQLGGAPRRVRDKTVILSVTGSPGEVRACLDLIRQRKREGGIVFPLAMEVNLSCPNIDGAPPPAYDAGRLGQYLEALPEDDETSSGRDEVQVAVGVKTPPYTYEGQFLALAGALARTAGRLSFVTATNTLGSCLVVGRDEGDEDKNSSKNGTAVGAIGGIDVPPRPVLPGAGVGGMAGPPLHPLALGNVAALRRVLDAVGLREVDVVGVGGVGDADGYRRMRAAGAVAVAVGTALGRRGVGVFGEIESGLEGRWEAYDAKL